MPKKASKAKPKASKAPGEVGGKETEDVPPPTPQEILELVTARKKLEAALMVMNADLILI